MLKIKLMVGYTSVEEAEKAYLQEMPEEFLSNIHEITLADLEQYKRTLVSLSTSRSLPIAANFAETEKDGVDLYATQLQERSAPIITDWIEQIRGLVQEAESFEEVRDRLFDLFPKLNTTDFTELMAQAMMAAEVGGSFEVIQETGNLES